VTRCNSLGLESESESHKRWKVSLSPSLSASEAPLEGFMLDATEEARDSTIRLDSSQRSKTKLSTAGDVKVKMTTNSSKMIPKWQPVDFHVGFIESCTSSEVAVGKWRVNGPHHYRMSRWHCQT
jgi:hypothetical protein